MSVLETLRVGLTRAKRAVIGRPDQIPRRVISALVLLTLAVAIGGVWLALRSGIETASTSSIGYLRPMLSIATSTWAYVAVFAWLVRRLLLKRNERYAEQAADYTGWQARSVRRLAYEAKSPDGSTRVIATSDDEPAEIRERIVQALDTGEDDTLSLNPDALAPAEADVDAPADRYEELLKELRTLSAEAEVLADVLDDGTGDLLGATFDEDAIAEAIKSGEDRFAPADLLDAGALELADELEATRDKLEENLARREEVLAELEEIEADNPALFEGTPAVDDVDDRPGRPVRLAGWLWRRATWPYRAALWVGDPREWPDRARARFEAFTSDGPAGGSADGSPNGSADGSAGGTPPEPVDEADLSDPWREQLKVFRLDLASSINLGDILWQAILPAGLTIAAILVVLQFWVKPWLYPPILATGGLVGILNYLRVSWTRSRRLEALRQERDTVSWSDVSILVKEIDVPETRIQYAWFGDRRYAHNDREEFAAELALRAYELLQDVDVSPSIMTKQATQLERMHPDLHGFRGAEKEQIMTWLLDRVEESQHGLIPVAKLIEDCIEHDLEGRRFGPGSRGDGYDPEIVREAYRELVPAALVEQEITVSDGNTLTAVRHRRDPLPPGFGEIRAQFSSQFGNYARWDPLYEIPDVSDQLEAEPIYAGKIGYSKP